MDIVSNLQSLLVQSQNRIYGWETRGTEDVGDLPSLCSCEEGASFGLGEAKSHALFSMLS